MEEKIVPRKIAEFERTVARMLEEATAAAIQKIEEEVEADMGKWKSERSYCRDRCFEG